jgi:hypothetical protein
MKKIILMLCMFIIICGCGGTFSGKFIFKNDVYKKGEKAYIVLGAVNNANNKDFDVNNFFIFKSKTGGKIKLFVKNGETTSFMINPGEYKLISYSIYGGVTYGTATKYVDLDFSKGVEGNFKIERGEAIYLGFVNTKITKVKRNLFKKIFNFGVNTEQEIQYETTVENLFEKIDKNKFEREVGKNLQVELLNWRRK